MSSSRNTGIDTLRGIGVLVVVMVHAGISGTLLRGALVIAVPLFIWQPDTPVKTPGRSEVS